VELLEMRLAVDDPGGSVSAHAAGGIWGLLAVALFVRAPGNALAHSRVSPGTGEGQWLAQLVGIAMLVGLVLPMTYGLNWLLNRFYPQRVAPEGEYQGLDLYELGAGAYPEFLAHADQSSQH
jgi:Amt family ammonium transporter